MIRKATTIISQQFVNFVTPCRTAVVGILFTDLVREHCSILWFLLLFVVRPLPHKWLFYHCLFVARKLHIILICAANVKGIRFNKHDACEAMFT